MRSFFAPLIVFGVIIVVILLSGAQGSEGARTASRAVGSLASFLPCIAILVIGLAFLWMIVPAIRISSQTSSTELYTEGERTGDHFDPDSLRYGHTPGTFTVETNKGRKFIIAIDKQRDMAAFQEVDRRGNSVGKPVLTNPHAIRFGKEPKRDLANHLRRKVEFKPPERH